jgi:hypothetical protein
MPKIPRLIVHLSWLIPLFLFLECSVRPVAEPDLYFYFALVENYLKTGRWPVKDPFLYTLPDDTLMTLHQWLGYWIYYVPYMAFGWAGPILLKSAAVLFFLGLPLIVCYRRRLELPYYFPLLWTVAVFIAHHRFRERVSLFGDTLTLLLCAGLIWCAEKRWFWYSLPVMFLAWAQLHPSFPLGWAILGGWFVLQRPRAWQKHQLICAGLCLLTPLINPMGLDGTLYPFRFARDIEPLLSQYVVEWLPLTDSRLYPFHFLYLPFVISLPLAAWQLGRQWREARLFEWMLLVLATALTLKSVRFGLVAQGIYLTLIVNAELRKPLLPLRPNWNWLALPFALLAGFVVYQKLSLSSRLHLTLAERFHVDTAYFPEEAAGALKQMNPKLHIFNSFGYGGYLAWRWQGDPRIFFHGFSTNFKFYEENYNRPQESVQDFDKLVAKYDIGIFFLARLGNDNNFIQILESHPGWQKIRQDDASVIFAKRDPRVFP